MLGTTPQGRLPVATEKGVGRWPRTWWIGSAQRALLGRA